MSISTWKLFICHRKLYSDLQTLNHPVTALLIVLYPYMHRDVSDLGLSRAQGPNSRFSELLPAFQIPRLVSPPRALFGHVL